MFSVIMICYPITVYYSQVFRLNEYFYWLNNQSYLRYHQFSIIRFFLYNCDMLDSLLLFDYYEFVINFDLFMLMNFQFFFIEYMNVCMTEHKKHTYYTKLFRLCYRRYYKYLLMI